MASQRLNTQTHSICMFLRLRYFTISITDTGKFKISQYIHAVYWKEMRVVDEPKKSKIKQSNFKINT